MNKLEYYKEQVRPRLSDYRYYHSLCVAESCRELALRYGADPEKAETAGILHDILKDTPANTMLQLAEQFGIILDVFEKGSRTLWHARIGSEFIRRELAIEDPDIWGPVRWHTTGKAGMTLPEKILFTADFISADRDYPGVEQMRALAEESLEEAMLEGLAFTLKELSEKRRVLHPDTLSAYNDLILQKERDSQ